MDLTGYETIRGVWTDVSPILRVAYIALVAALPFGVLVRLDKISHHGGQLFSVLHSAPVLWMLVEISLRSIFLLDAQWMHFTRLPPRFVVAHLQSLLVIAFVLGIHTAIGMIAGKNFMEGLPKVGLLTGVVTLAIDVLFSLVFLARIYA